MLTAIVVNESYTGCSLILVSDTKIQTDQMIKAKIADLDPLECRVVWCKILEENILKVGLEFNN